MFGCRQLTPPIPTPQSPSSALEGGSEPGGAAGGPEVGMVRAWGAREVWRVALGVTGALGRAVARWGAGGRGGGGGAGGWVRLC